MARVVYLYRVQFEYQQALDALEALEEKHTLGASALMLKAFLLRRLCRFEEAYQMVTAAKKLDPRSIQTVSQVITMAWEVDDCDASSAYARAAMALAADVLVVRLSVARSELQCNGNGQRANELLKDSEFNGFFQVLIAEMAAAAARDWSRLLAISEYSLPQEGPLFSTIGQLDGALALRNLNRTQDANAFMDSVKEKMEAVEDNPLIVESSVFARIKSFYFAFQGDKDATGEWVMETKQRREKENRGDQALKVSQYLYDARILTLAGLHSEAIEELRLSLESPGGDRFPLIDALPIFDVLKEDSGYIASRQRYADAD